MSDDPPPEAKRIHALYAWVAEHPNGAEGLCGAMTPNQMMPLVGADIERMRSLRSFAELTRAATGFPVRLIRFSRRDDLEELP